MTTTADLVAIPVEDLPADHPAAPVRRRRKQLTGFQFMAAFVGVAGSGFGVAFVAAQIINRAAS